MQTIKPRRLTEAALDTALDEMRCSNRGGYKQAQGEYKLLAHIAAIEAEMDAAQGVVSAARRLILAVNGPQPREMHALADALARLDG